MTIKGKTLVSDHFGVVKQNRLSDSRGIAPKQVST